MLETSTLLTPDEVAKFLRVSLSHVRKLTCRKLIPHTKIGKSVRYPARRIENWLASNTVEPRRPVALRGGSR